MLCKHPKETCANMIFYHEEIYCDNQKRFCCLYDEPLPYTNATNIRDMNNKELAEFLMSDWFARDVCKNCEGEYDRCGDLKFCESKILEWLLKMGNKTNFKR